MKTEKQKNIKNAVNKDGKSNTGENNSADESSSYNLDKENDIDDIMSGINKILAEQITNELDKDDPKSENPENTVQEKKRNKVPKWMKISGVVFGILLILGTTGILIVNSFLDRVNITDWSDTKQQEEVFEEGDGTGTVVDPDSVSWDKNTSLRVEKNVLNFLLVGEEAIGSGGGRGRTDSIMIATINVKQKALKLTSLMRDMYVQIPGFSDNKLNAAYHNGGMPLLKETLEKNFDIQVDGSVLVNFDGFESIIDKLGGVTITLTESEARYLNTTNYISKPIYRKVKAGTQKLNGNQALGYSRVRYREASSGERDDFGRTSRQRTVLNAVFEEYKSKNAAELILLLNDIFPLVTTDIQKPDMVSYITTVVTMGTTKLDTLRIPADNAYTGANIRGMSVLLPDMTENIKLLQEFIFGTPDTPAVSSETGTVGSSPNSANHTGFSQ